MDQGLPEGICSQVLRSTSVDSYRFESIRIFRVKIDWNCNPRGSTQVLLCLFPGVLWLWHLLYSGSPHTVSNLHKYTFVMLQAFMAGAASQAGDADSSGHLVSYLVCRGPWMSTVVLYYWCHSDSASVLLYFTFLWVFTSSLLALAWFGNFWASFFNFWAIVLLRITDEGSYSKCAYGPYC